MMQPAAHSNLGVNKLGDLCKKKCLFKNQTPKFFPKSVYVNINIYICIYVSLQIPVYCISFFGWDLGRITINSMNEATKKCEPWMSFSFSRRFYHHHQPLGVLPKKTYLDVPGS